MIEDFFLAVVPRPKWIVVRLQWCFCLRQCRSRYVIPLNSDQRVLFALHNVHEPGSGLIVSGHHRGPPSYPACGSLRWECCAITASPFPQGSDDDHEGVVPSANARHIPEEGLVEMEKNKNLEKFLYEALVQVIKRPAIKSTIPSLVALDLPPGGP